MSIAGSCPSYGSRQGRITPAQKKVLANPNNPYLIDPIALTPIDWEELFATKPSSKKIVEIGFGNGTSLVEAAHSRPDDLFIGIEVYPSGIASLLMAIEKKGIENIRVLRADAQNTIESLFRPDSLDEIWIFFPDPWPKRRHHKRRLLKSPFIEILLVKLKRAGLLHIVTDWQDYANSILASLENCSDCHNLYDRFAPSPANHRFTTKFELLAKKEHMPVFEMLFTKA